MLPSIPTGGVAVTVTEKILDLCKHTVYDYLIQMNSCSVSALNRRQMTFRVAAQLGSVLFLVSSQLRSVDYLSRIRKMERVWLLQVSYVAL